MMSMFLHVLWLLLLLPWHCLPSLLLLVKYSLLYVPPSHSMCINSGCQHDGPMSRFVPARYPLVMVLCYAPEIGYRIYVVATRRE
jgi:hypothetical protein